MIIVKLLYDMQYRRWWLRFAAVVLLTLGVAVGTALYTRDQQGSAGEKEVAEAVEVADRTDPDWRWEPLNAKRPRPPEGKNGADLIPRIRPLVPKGWGHKLNSSEWEAIRDVPTNARYPGEVIDEAKRECEAAKDAIALARTMKDCPLGLRVLKLAPNVIGTLLPDTQDTRLVVSLLKWDVVLAIEAGDKPRAADSLLAMLATSRSLGDETFLISQLVRIAIRIIASRTLEWSLAQTELPADRSAALQAAWAADAEEPLLLYALRGERAAMDVLMQNLLDGTVDPATWAEVGDVHQGVQGRFGWWWYRGSRLPGDRARMLATFNALIEVARKPVDEQVRSSAPFKDPPFDDHHRIHKLLFPAVEKVASSYWRSVAETRSTVAAIACERYRLKHGRWPASLAALAPEFLSAVPLDPFDGQPLRLKRLPDGIVIYSIGADRTDDGGDLRRIDNPYGKDEGFRLWDMKERRKPVLEKPAEPKADP